MVGVARGLKRLGAQADLPGGRSRRGRGVCRLLPVRGGLILAAALLTLTFGVTRVDARPDSQRGGRIIFIIGESGDIGPSPNLVMMNADGSNSHLRLHWALHASFSPKGRSIAYELIGEPNTRVIAADGPLRDRLLIRNASSADWSPVGGAVAFVRDGDAWVKSLRTGAQTRVVRNATYPEWSPDGKRLAFVRNNDAWTVDLATRRPHRLIRDAGCGARWSPDGRRIAFERCTRYGQSDIYVALADGTSARRVAEGGSPAWSPDGHEIAFSDGRRIIRIRPDGTHRHVVWGNGKGYCACRDLDWKP
jgi:dipeptidyl aminopeptidase/acylaminoacyl peptidase